MVSMIKRKVWVFFITGTVSLLSAHAFAYTIGDVDLELTGSLRETYDDNITSASVNPKDDLRTDLSIGLKARSETKNRLLELSGTVTRHSYDTYNDFNNTSQSFLLNLTQELSKYDRFTLRDSFRRADEPNSFDDQFGGTVGRYRYSRNTASLDYSRDLTKQLTVLGRYAYDTNLRSRADQIDSYEHRGGVEFDYAFSSKILMLFGYDLSRRWLKPGSDATTNSLTLGGRYYLTNQLYFDLRSGIDFIDSYSGERYRKPAFQLGFTNELDQRTAWSISYLRNYAPASDREDLFNSWRISTAWGRELLERLRLNLSGFYGEGEFLGSGITDITQGGTLGISYDLRDNMVGTLSYSYAETSSNDSGREYKRNTVSAGMNVKF